TAVRCSPSWKRTLSVERCTACTLLTSWSWSRRYCVSSNRTDKTQRSWRMSQRGPRHLAFSLHSQDELGIDHQRAACESFPSLFGEPRRGSLRAWPSALLICRQLVCPFWCHG